MVRTRKNFKTPKVLLIKDDYDLEMICSLLKAKEELILNISLIDIKTRYRLIDFISGFVYAFSGERKKIEDNIYSFKI